MIYDVSQQELVLKVAQELKNQIEMPEWAKFVKTGVHRETMPKNPDWWYIRAASILRVTHKLGPVGVSKLRTRYGGRKNRGMRPDAFREASGKIIRTILQQLEKAELIKQHTFANRKGRIATPKGVSLMMNVAKQILSTKSVEKKAEKKPVKKEVSKEEKKVVESKTDKAETPAKKQETVNTEPKVKAESQKTDKPEAD